MTSIIGSSTNVSQIQPVPPVAQQIKPSAKDSDGDNDGSKVGEVDKPAAISGSVGTIVNTKA
jgi:hypothetical protein